MDTIYDLHSHIKDIEELETYLSQGIVPLVNCRSLGEFLDYSSFINETSYDSSEVLYSIGLHPHDADRILYNFSNKYEDLIRKAPIVGEIGMDSCWTDLDRKTQETSFLYSLGLAKKYNKPVVLHTKGMEREILEIIQDFDLTYIVHWYGCSDYQEDYRNLGVYFTIGPAIFSDPDVEKLVSNVDLDKLLLETDGIEALRWLDEEHFDKRRLRDNLEDVYRKIAEIKALDYEFVKNTIVNTSKDLIKKYKGLMYE